MNKKLRELLDQINAVKAEVVNLVNDGKLEEAKAKKAELQNLQEKFDTLKDVMDPEGTGEIQDVGNASPIEDRENDAIHEFAEAARHRFQNINTEGVPADGGYTVPEDIQTRVNRFREAKFSLQSLVATEKVNTMAGARTFLTKAQHTGFSSVAEAAAIGKKSGPEFERVEYSITKYAGYLPVTNELLADSDAAISNLLIEWLGEEDVATRNKLILAAVAEKTATVITDLDDIKNAINVTLGQAYAGNITIVTNDEGLQYLDTLKDENKRYLLSPDINPDSPFSMTLAVGARRIPLVIVPSAILPTVEAEQEGDDEGIPFIIGDLKEYVRIFDRQQLSIMTSNTAAVGSGDGALNAFEQDLTLFRGITRLDAEVIDEDAIVYGLLAVGE